jgi:hypothetical protein
MAVTLNGKKPIDATKQWVFCTLTVDGDVCKHITVQPYNNDTTAIITVDSELETYLNNKEAVLELAILKNMYPGALYQKSAGDTATDRFYQWIADGRINHEEVIQTVDLSIHETLIDKTVSNPLDYKPPSVESSITIVESVIEKVPYLSQFNMPHPEKAEAVDRGHLSDGTMAMLNNAVNVEDIKTFLQTVFKTV